MADDNCLRVSSPEFDSSPIKQSRKKRKWDQPDEALVSAGVAIPGIFPLTSVRSLARITLPAVSSATSASLAIPLSGSIITSLPALQVPFYQHAAAIVQNLIQPKIQDELIAREICINDADSSIRYKLTKRQTQEEIQKSTDSVVITRGKYRPPNVSPDGEKPLYLHISAAAHLETTAERIKAVDRAAAMVEEILKQGTMSSGVKVDHVLTTSVFLGFQPDPSLDIISRIYGPNGQYVNHIMNETGATVLIQGRGFGYPENEHSEETQQPLHLLLSSNNAKSLEHAKLLAENLLDTICGECGSSRISSCKVYGAVPPPPQLHAGVHIPAYASKQNNVASVNSTALGSVNTVCSQGLLPQSLVALNPILPQGKPAYYLQGLSSATSYNGYGGIYPQATPLQQVALALRQSNSPVTATVSTATICGRTDGPEVVSSLAKDKRSQKRKFQELPAVANGPTNLKQGTKYPMPRQLTSHLDARDVSSDGDRKSFVKQSCKDMPPPPPVLKSSSTPSCPPKVDSISKVHGEQNGARGSQSEVMSDTLTKLMEYGDDDDDDDDDEIREPPSENHSNLPCSKPFWAV